MLELPVATDNALGNATQEMGGSELLRRCGERFLGLVEMVGGEEEEGQVHGGAAESLAGFPRSLGGGLHGAAAAG